MYNYWIGLEHLYQMTHKQPYQMRVTLEYWNDTRVYASYSTFRYRPVKQSYALSELIDTQSLGDSNITFGSAFVKVEYLRPLETQPIMICRLL